MAHPSSTVFDARVTNKGMYIDTKGKCLAAGASSATLDLDGKGVPV